MTTHRTGTREEWLAARRELLEREKEHTRLGDELTRQRQELPWVTIDKPYSFETSEGTKTLAELFDGRSQLLVYHFMLGPDRTEGCVSCSFLADHLDGPRVHLEHHDVTLACVSRAPIATIAAYRRRMGWGFPWVSSLGSDFNFDFGVSFTDGESSGNAEYNFESIGYPGIDELPGMSAFALEDGVVYHTYSLYARGGDALIGAHQLLDRAPKGRNEDTIMDWVRRHDEYAEAVTS
ncbi:MAG: DUF899 domain-containing protein [Actinomycetota bacterium]|nr:DUF899 domain-containing protein [Actinomycetota bacterium]